MYLCQNNVRLFSGPLPNWTGCDISAPKPTKNKLTKNYLNTEKKKTFLKITKKEQCGITKNSTMSKIVKCGLLNIRSLYSKYFLVHKLIIDNNDQLK